MTNTSKNSIKETSKKTAKHEHLTWCKMRAFEYIDKGDVSAGWETFLSDMNKHPETATHIVLELGVVLHMQGHLDNPHDMKNFIEAIN